MIEVTILVVILLILSITILKFWNKLKKWKEQLRFIASIITLVSIIFAVGTFYYEQTQIKKIELENQKVLLYALRDEIETDIEFAEHISNKSKRFLETYELPINRFSTVTIREVINKGDVGDVEFKTKLRKVYNRMEDTNRLLDQVSIFIPLTQEQAEVFFKLKKELVIVLIKSNDKIKPSLYDLRSRADSLIQSLEKS